MTPTIIGYYKTDGEFQIVAALIEHPQAPLIAALQYAHPGRQLIVAEQQEIEYDTELVGNVIYTGAEPSYIEKLACMGITYDGDGTAEEAEGEAKEAEGEAKDLFEAIHDAYYTDDMDDPLPRWQYARQKLVSGDWQVEEIGGLALNFERWLNKDES